MIESTPKQLLVELQMSRTTNKDWRDSDVFKLRITDKASHLLIFEITITQEDLMNLLSTRSTEASETLCYPSYDKWGKYQVVKDVLVPVKDEEKYKSGLINNLNIRAQQLAGSDWTVDKESGFNSHRYSNSNQTYRFTARKWVDENPEKKELK